MYFIQIIGPGHKWIGLLSISCNSRPSCWQTKTRRNRARCAEYTNPFAGASRALRGNYQHVTADSVDESEQAAARSFSIHRFILGPIRLSGLTCSTSSLSPTVTQEKEKSRIHRSFVCLSCGHRHRSEPSVRALQAPSSTQHADLLLTCCSAWAIHLQSTCRIPRTSTA